MIEQPANQVDSFPGKGAVQPGRDRPSWHILLALGLLGLILYAPSLNDGFHFDDDLILNDSNVTTLERWQHFFNPLRLRQVTFFSFYLNYQIGGDDPFLFHAVNLGIHIANAYLLLYLLFPLVGRWMASVAALVFLAHPIQTEAVVYIYQRSTLLGTCFGLVGLFLIASSSGRDGDNLKTDLKANNRLRMLMAGVFFLLAFESKETALAMPLLLIPVVGLKGRGIRRIVAGVVLLSTAALGILASLGEETVGVGAINQVGPWSYFLTEVRVMYTYLRLLIFPYPQSLEYDFAKVDSAFEPSVLAWLVGLVLLLCVSLWLLKHPRHRWAGIGASSFFVLLAPTSSVIPSLDFAFEHRLYMPMLGFALFVAYWLARLRRRNAIIGVMVLVLAALTLNRERAWSSEVALWEDTVRKAPEKSRAWFNLGGAHLESDPARAQEAFLNVIELEGEFPEALYNLGVIDQGEGDNLSALGWYQRTLRQDPDYWPAINNMGNVRFGLTDYTGAIADFERTLELNEDYWPAQYNLAIVYVTLGRPDNAVPKLRIVLDWRPEFSEARYLLALALDQLGSRVEAQREFEQLDPAFDRRRSGFTDLSPLPAMN